MLEEGLDSDLAIGLAKRIDWNALPGLDEVHSNLFHYWHDDDIRKKDADYARMQNEELRKLIRFLKEKDFSNAKRISFLGESRA